MRTCRLPASDPITVRNARAVLPPLPMTLPRSSGCTRTSRTLPRRSILLATRTSSGCVTMPLTRCSRASSSTSGSGTAIGSLGRRFGRRAGVGLGLGLSLGLGGGRSLGGLSLSLGLGLGGDRSRGGLSLLRLVPLRRGPGRLRRGLGLLRRLAFLHQRLVALFLFRLRLGGLQRALGSGLALELLPVTGDGEQVAHRVGRLRANREPVLDSLRVHLDDRRVRLRVITADLLDGAPR